MLVRALSLVCFLTIVIAGNAEAQRMMPILPGVMCESAEALGQLTQNDGSSRSEVKTPTPEALAVKARGGCRDLYPGDLIERRKNTSVIMTDPQDGKGLRRFYVPNIVYSLTVDNLPALRANSAITNLPKECETDSNKKITIDGIVRSDLFAQEGGKSYCYHYLFVPEAACVATDTKTLF